MTWLGLLIVVAAIVYLLLADLTHQKPPQDRRTRNDEPDPED